MNVKAFMQGFVETYTNSLYKQAMGNSNVQVVPVPQDMLQDMPEAEPTLVEPYPESDQAPTPQDMREEMPGAEDSIKKKDPESSQAPMPQDMLESKEAQAPASMLASLLEAIKRAKQPIKGLAATANLGATIG